MTVETKDINEVLPVVLNDVAQNKDQQRAIEEYLVENHKMERGTFLELVSQPEKAENLSDEQVAVILNAVHQVTQSDDTVPSQFFSAKVVKVIRNFKFEKEEEISLPLTIDGVIRVNSENHLAAFSYKFLRDIYVNKILTYNFESQRLSKKSINKAGKIKEKADIKSKSVESIKKLMKEGKYEPSTIIINILVDGSSRISYEDGSLTIYEGSTINIIDGAHRVEAIVSLLEEESDHDGYMNVDIKYFPIEKAQKHLATTNTVNRFDKTLVKYYGGDEYGQEIAKYLMTIPVLKNRIEIKTAIDKKITITNFAIMSEAIQSIFNPQNSKEKYDVQDVLKKFYEYLIPSFEEELVKNRIKNLETSWISHHNMHVGFIAIAKKLYDKYGKDFPVDEIVKIINSIDFNKQTSPVNEIMGGQGKVNSNKVKQQLREWIESETDKILK